MNINNENERGGKGRLSNQQRVESHHLQGVWQGGERSFPRGSCDVLYVSVRPEDVTVGWGDHIYLGSVAHLKL